MHFSLATMTFVQPICDSFWDKFIFHTYIMFLLSLFLSCFGFRVNNFFYENIWLSLSCQVNGCSNNTPP